MPFLPQLYLFHIIFFLLLFLILLSFLLRGKLNLKIKNVKFYLYFFLFWFFWALISFSWVNDKLLAAKFTFIYFIMFLFLWLIIFYNRNKDIFKTTLKILFFMSLIALIVGTLEVFTDFRLPASPYSDLNEYDIDAIQILSATPTSFFGNPNNYATFLVFFLPFILFGFQYSLRRKEKIGFFSLAILIAINIIMTDSKINILALLFVVLIYLLFSLIRKFSLNKIIKIFPLFLIMIFMTFFIVNSNDFLKTRYERTFHAVDAVFSGRYSFHGGDSISIRMTILKEITSPPSIANLLFGFGVGNSRDYLEQQNIPHGIVDPHNWWLEILGDFGLILFFGYLIFFVFLLKSLWKIIKRRENPFIVYISSSCFVSLLGFTVSSMGPSSIAYFFPHWILVGLSMVVINLFKK